MGSIGYSPGCSLGPQGYSPSLCHPHDLPQPADLGLRGHPGKSSPSPHPSCTPVCPLSPAPPTSVFTVSHRTPPADHATSEQIPGVEQDLENTQVVPSAGWSMSWVSGSTATYSPGSPIGGVPSYISWDWLKMETLFLLTQAPQPQAGIQAEENSASSWVFDWLTSQAHPLIGFDRERGLIIPVAGSIPLGFRRLAGNTQALSPKWGLAQVTE